MQTYSTRGKTKRALADALIGKLESTPISQITVQELADSCGIKRQSFYHHFADIYALLEWILKQDQPAFVKIQETCFDWQSYVLAVMKLLEKDKKKYIAVSNALGWHYIERFYQIDVRAFLDKAVLFYAKGSGSLVLRPEYVLFLQSYYAIVLSALMESWLQGKVPYSAEELIQKFLLLIEDETRGALQRNEALLSQVR